MKCKCALDCDYKVVGMCDIEEFNSKISEFEDNSWSKMTSVKSLKIPNDRPKVNKIQEINIKIKINKINMVDTPKANLNSIEGFKLTGKMLLVTGELCGVIFYKDNEDKRGINCIKFKDEFSTHIVIDKEITKTDIYNVYPCIENIFANILNSETINLNVNLFLFAHKVEIPIEITNEFILTNIRNNTVVKVGFDSDKKVLKIMNTEFEIPAGVEREEFKFELIGNDGVLKESGIVKSNQVANDFTTSLNQKSFKYDDIIKLTFREFQYVTLTDYPIQGDNYTMLAFNNQSFRITKEGIVPNVLLNTIILNDINNLPVLNINFDKLTKKMLLQATNNRTNPAYRTEEYFRVTIKGSFDRTVFINGDETGSLIANRLFGQPFEYGDTITLSYKERDKVVIINFPTEGDIGYNPMGMEETYRITTTGLIKI